MPDVTEIFNRSNTAQDETTGRLDLVFQQDPEGRSYLADQFFTYPFHICRAQYSDSALPNMATLYLQSSAGGVFRGDRLEINILGKEKSQSHITTQASTIIHSMENDAACQRVHIIGEEGALIEYLPDCTILFPQAKLRSSISVTRHPDCDVILGDSFLTHDPDHGDRPFGWLENELIIRGPDESIDVIDRFILTGEQFNSGELSLAKDYRVHGTFVVITQRKDLMQLPDALRNILNDHEDVYAGVTALPCEAGFFVRYLATDGLAAKKFYTDLWFHSRIALTGSPPNIRRK